MLRKARNQHSQRKELRMRNRKRNGKELANGTGKVITVVFGATTGCSVDIFAGGKCTTVSREDIPWITVPDGDGGEAIYWPNRWVEGKLLLLSAWAEPGDIICVGMPGADLALVRGEPRFHNLEFEPVQHYRSVPAICQEVVESTNVAALYRRQNGALVASFQPPAQLLAEAKRRPAKLRAAKAIVPFCDVMTYWLTQTFNNEPILGHDRHMLQDQGLSNRRDMRRWLTKLVGGFAGLEEKLVPWKLFREREMIRTSSGVMIMPVSHDSVYSRLVGLAFCPKGIWTGTWVGSFQRPSHGFKPNDDCLKLGLAFEGYGHASAAITNCAGMAGAAYKWMKDQRNYSYQRAAELACECLGIHSQEKLAPVFKSVNEPDFAKEWFLTRFGGQPNGLAALVEAVAYSCICTLEDADKMFGTRSDLEVAITGGWAENKAFLKAIDRLKYTPVIPPFASQATSAGLAAEALVRAKRAATFAEALSLLEGK